MGCKLCANEVRSQLTFKLLSNKIQVKEDSATENENIESRKIDEQHKFSLDAEFVWILQKSGRRWSTVLWYGKCAYSERSDISTEQLIFVSLKKKEKKKKKEMKNNQSAPGVDRGTLERQRCVVPLSYVNILIKNHYKTSDNSAGSSLFEDFLLVNFLVL